ncbi:hypothetical protein ColLi_05020 [Colletotrichum liriopes]|uniref:Uncharacterized protein n=1 Tax=Colletotrichum liriopes TaxID=708192 RepID=A0AA37LRZ0_9PEZI|nr:hypothetical protein ColLi_05020 [Colletotrichum liriopes]
MEWTGLGIRMEGEGEEEKEEEGKRRERKCTKRNHHKPTTPTRACPTPPSSASLLAFQAEDTLRLLRGGRLAKATGQSRVKVREKGSEVLC